MNIIQDAHSYGVVIRDLSNSDLNPVQQQKNHFEYFKFIWKMSQNNNIYFQVPKE